MTRRLKIGLLAPPWSPVPPTSYGGTELVVAELAHGLVAEGHDVELYASPTGEWERIGQGLVEFAYVMRGYEVLAGCDVIHDHSLLGPAWALALGGWDNRLVTTCHGPLDAEVRTVYRQYGKRMPLVAISHDQAGRAPDVPVDRVIHHGIDPDAYPAGPGGGGYVMFLGRMTPDKGVREAIVAARDAGRRLLLSAKIREDAERAYFESEIRPLLCGGAGGDVTLVGEATTEQKINLLGGADALLNPIRWPEPFGLVMIEALACGTPVVTRPFGAAPEIVDHGVTGFLCTGHDELVEALGRVAEIDRATCRQAVLTRFSHRRMAADHIALYQELLRR